MRIVSFNINGIRARPHQLRAIRDVIDPDILALQEIKVADELFPQDIAKSLGYHASIYGQKGHYGVAILSKQPPLTVHLGNPCNASIDVDQRRLITGKFVTPGGEQLVVINGYFPQGGNRKHPLKFPYKKKFYAELIKHLQTEFSPTQPLLIVGDMNVAPLDIDVGLGKDNAARWLRTGACGFLPEERMWLRELVNWGLVDLFRNCYPQVTDHLSWFDYRSRGFEADPKRGLRVDLMLATVSVAQRCTDAGMGYTIRNMERPSDHCPVWADLDL